MTKYSDIKSESDAILIEESRKRELLASKIEQRYRQSLNAVSSLIYNELDNIGAIFFGKRTDWFFMIPITKKNYLVTADR